MVHRTLFAHLATWEIDCQHTCITLLAQVLNVAGWIAPCQKGQCVIELFNCGLAWAWNNIVCSMEGCLFHQVKEGLIPWLILKSNWSLPTARQVCTESTLHFILEFSSGSPLSAAHALSPASLRLAIVLQLYQHGKSACFVVCSYFCGNVSWESCTRCLISIEM